MASNIRRLRRLGRWIHFGLFVLCTLGLVIRCIGRRSGAFFAPYASGGGIPEVINEVAHISLPNRGITSR